MGCCLGRWIPQTGRSTWGWGGAHGAPYLVSRRPLDDGEYQHIQQLAYEFGPFDDNEDVYHRNSPFFAVKNIMTLAFIVHREGRFPESPQMKHFADEPERHYKVFRYKVVSR